MDADDRTSPELLIGDITRLEVDGIVDAVNEPLSRDGGVDGAIHAACDRNSLEAASESGLRSVAFPAIGAGALGDPTAP